jgi:hypothetical protein
MRCPHAACPTASGLRLGPDILPAGGTAASASSPRPVPGGHPIDAGRRVIDDGAPGHFFAESGRPYAAHLGPPPAGAGLVRVHGVEPRCPCSLAVATCAAVE